MGNTKKGTFSIPNYYYLTFSSQIIIHLIFLTSRFSYSKHLYIGYSISVPKNYNAGLRRTPCLWL
jgi:hypothetical protein